MSSPTLALIPAKRTSTGVPDKNWKPITPDGWNCASLAIQIGLGACDRSILSLDDSCGALAYNPEGMSSRPMIVHRPHGLPDTMLAVVQDALQQVPGADDEIIVLLQPTSPLRTAETVRKAIQMLEDDPDATSVVSVSPSYPVEWTLVIDTLGALVQACPDKYANRFGYLFGCPDRRQECKPVFKRDGIVYTFRRGSFNRSGDIYGWTARPLHTPPAESLSIDTPEDWDEAVRRLAAQDQTSVTA